MLRSPSVRRYPRYGIVPPLAQEGPPVFDPTQISTSLKPLLPDASSALRETDEMFCGEDNLTSIQRGPPLIMSKRLLHPLLKEMII